MELEKVRPNKPQNGPGKGLKKRGKKAKFGQNRIPKSGEKGFSKN